MIALGSDHGGYKLKEAVKKYFDANNIEYKDCGTNNEDSVDYAVYALAVTDAIKSGECEKGILFCGTGLGISIAANKVKGIRAAVCTNEFCAEMCRRHNNANIIAFGGRVITEEQCLKMTDIFLNTEFEGGRHAQRVAQIEKIEKDGKL
ncbi:MAG: ribose 5-phosphate isomerase B [Clostridia bacterium]|nr:ribose 5-phosphate isomerase B [Clostridia bacterium]